MMHNGMAPFKKKSPSFWVSKSWIPNLLVTISALFRVVIRLDNYLTVVR